MDHYEIRPAGESDLVRVNEIYNWYIVDRHTSFDTEPWTMEQRRQWFRKYQHSGGGHQLLVLTIDGVVMGFASSSPFRDKAAYDTSVETTIVLDERAVGRGLGEPLLVELLTRLEAQAVHRAYALIALPNETSVVLHTRLGYREVGVLDEAGHKLDRFHSVLIMECRFPRAT